MSESVRTYRIRLVGTTPLVMHNNQLVNPLHPLKKAIASITAKGKKKTEADILKLYRLEFQASLYIDGLLGPYIPAQNLRKLMIEAARKSKDGKQFESGLFIDADAPVEYEGPRDMEGLLGRMDDFAWTTVCGNQRASIMRTRARFKTWAAEFSAIVETSLVSPEMIDNALSHSRFIGICDGRSINCGRFNASIADQPCRSSRQDAADREPVSSAL